MRRIHPPAHPNFTAIHVFSGPHRHHPNQWLLQARIGDAAAIELCPVSRSSFPAPRAVPCETDALLASDSDVSPSKGQLSFLMRTSLLVLLAWACSVLSACSALGRTEHIPYAATTPAEAGHRRNGVLGTGKRQACAPPKSANRIGSTPLGHASSHSMFRIPILALLEPSLRVCMRVRRSHCSGALRASTTYLRGGTASDKSSKLRACS